MASGPVLRAVVEAGDTYEDPSEDVLFTLLADVEEGHGRFVIVERTADTSGQTYAQAYRNDDGTYLVEHRDGGPGAHYRASSKDVRQAHKVLTQWAFQLDGWTDEVTWTRVRL